MYNKIIGIFIFYFSFYIANNAQILIHCDSIPSWSGNLFELSEIRHYDLANNCQEDTYGSQYPYFTDIAVTFDSLFYGYGFLAPITQDTLFGFFFVDESSGGGYSFEHYGHFQIDTLIQGLTCDTLSTIYGAGKGITLWENGIETYLGDLPSNMQCQGDLTFYDGTLYMVAVGNKLVEINQQIPLLSNLVFEFDSDILPIHGLATIKVDCDSSVVYATGRASDFSYSQIYQVDFENQTLIEVCDIDHAIWGSASYSECAPAPCEVEIDLDVDDSSGGFINNFYSDISCISPIAVTDNDINLLSEPGLVDSIRIQLVGILDANQEYLTIPNATNLQVFGDGTASIRIINLGNASLADFEEVIKEMLYWNGLSVPTYGVRDVVFTAYSGVYEGEPSYSFVSLSNFGFSQFVQTIYPCDGDSSGSIILTPFGGTAPYIIEWYTGDTGTTISNVAAGHHPFTITDSGGCYREASHFLFQPPALDVLIELTGSTIICDSSGFLTAIPIGGDWPFSFEWNNGVETNTNINIPADVYVVTLTDSYNCTAIDSIYLTDTIFVNQTTQLCEGEVFEFNNTTISTDTTLCLGLTSIDGCDSIHCLEVSFIDSILVMETTEICIGETFAFNGISFTQDTFLCLSYNLSTGCDSTICLDLQVLGSITTLNDSFCENGSYDFGEQILITEGLYFDTLVSINNCDSIIILDLVVNPIPVIQLTTDGSLCTQNNVEISAGQHDFYQWSNEEVSPSIIISTPNKYFVTVTDNQGCLAIDSILIQDNTLEIFPTVIHSSCFDEDDGQIIIDSVEGGTPPFVYALNGQSFQSENNFINLEPNNYTVLVEDVDGCQRSIELTLEEPGATFIELEENMSIQLGEEISFNPTTNIENPIVQWIPSDYLSCDTCLNTDAIPEQSLQYQIILTDENGCSIFDYITISIDEHKGIYIPNVFSPNGDSFNDFFTAYSDESIESILSFQIFNRWGALVFEQKNIPTNTPSFGWDGTLNNGLVQTGAYVYLIEFLRIDGVVQLEKGDVLLIR